MKVTGYGNEFYISQRFGTFDPKKCVTALTISSKINTTNSQVRAIIVIKTPLLRYLRTSDQR